MNFLRAHDITIGGYLPGSTVLHRLDPRTKIVGFFLMLGSVFVSSTGLGVASAGLVVIALMCATAVGWKVWAWGLTRFTWMLVLTFGVNLFFDSAGQPATIGPWALPITGEAVEKSLVFTTQLVEAIVLSLALTFTTSPVDLARGAERLARPMKRLGVSVEDYGLVLLLALRFLPLFQQEVRNTVEAQRCRGIEFGEGNVASRAKDFVAVLVPSLTNTLRRADILAAAMTARGFRPGAPRSEYRPLRFSKRDHAALLLAMLFFVGRLTVI